MVYKIRIRRQESQKSDSYWQEFEFDGSKNSSVANVLKELNSRTPLKDNSGTIVTPISWECSCMVRKCGACAMLINERPRLACSYISTYVKRFYNHLGTFKQISACKEI